MKLKHVGIIVVSVLAMSSAAVSAAEGDESVTTTVNGGVIHFKGEVVNAACAIDSESMNQTVPDNFQRPVAQVLPSLFRLR